MLQSYSEENLLSTLSRIRNFFWGETNCSQGEGRGDIAGGKTSYCGEKISYPGS